jgi:hypothetical protein
MGASRLPINASVSRYFCIADILASPDGLLGITIACLPGVGLEVRGVGQPVSPLEPVLPHYSDDAPPAPREPLSPARACRYAGHVYG